KLASQMRTAFSSIASNTGSSSPGDEHCRSCWHVPARSAFPRRASLREQQTATSEVLSVISSSAGELRPVFEIMLAKAIELCQAKFGAMWLVDGEGYRTAALHGDLPEAYLEQWRSGTLHRPTAAIPMVRAIRSRKPVHVADMLEEKAYLEGDPLAVSVVHPNVSLGPDAQGGGGNGEWS